MANVKTHHPKKVNPRQDKVQAATGKNMGLYMDEYQTAFPSQADKWLSGAGILLILFALMGLTWSAPFPQLHFIGKYAAYFNWASFLIAFYVAYYYFKLSPLYSYIILLVLFGLSYIVTEIDLGHQHGGLAVWTLSAPVLIAGLVLLLIARKGGAVANTFKFILVGPACIMKLLLKR